MAVRCFDLFRIAMPTRTCGRNLSVEGLIDHIKKAVNLQAGLERRSSGLTRFLGLIEAHESHSAQRDYGSQ